MSKFFVFLRTLTFASPLAWTFSVGSMSALPVDRLSQTPPSEEVRTVLSEQSEMSDDLESLLVQSLKAIQQHRFDDALQLVDRAIEMNPKFRLAHLVRGDLLLAKVRPLDGMGTASDANQDSLVDLQKEAIARLGRYEMPPPVHLVPDALLEMSPQQKFAVLVDSEHSRIYVFENRDGRPRYLTDYYVSVGKLGVGKNKEGDKRTPLGVYHVTKALDPANLPDLYGDGAYPINYPNPLDKREGRTGYGIWLHGSPSDTYSRPPQASDGCVVLTNPDIVSLGEKLQVGYTPVVITPKLHWIKPSEREQQRRELTDTLETWRQAWESHDAARYLSFYAPDFWTDGGGHLSQWSETQTRVLDTADWQAFRIDNVSIFRYPADQFMVEVRFETVFDGGQLAQNGVQRKRQYWVKSDKGWKIIYEGAA